MRHLQAAGVAALTIMFALTITPAHAYVPNPEPYPTIIHPPAVAPAVPLAETGGGVDPWAPVVGAVMLLGGVGLFAAKRKERA